MITSQGSQVASYQLLASKCRAAEAAKREGLPCTPRPCKAPSSPRPSSATPRRAGELYSVYWDAVQADCVMNSDCSNTPVDVTKWGLRGTKTGYAPSGPVVVH